MPNIGPRILRLPQAVYRLLINRNVWKYSCFGYCASCDSNIVFVFSYDIDGFLDRITRNWDQGPQFIRSLRERENYVCAYCLANFRMRSLAQTVLKIAGVVSTGGLIRRLRRERTFAIYETASYSIFRAPEFRGLPNYVVSEFFDDLPPGCIVNGVRNENLECLSFPDASFDIVITSEVLEHVSDLNRCVSEIQRVLKPGGWHVFTVPADPDQGKTRERAVMRDGKVAHLRDPVMHGDSIRREGILAFRDFGNDVPEYLGRDGLPCTEERTRRDDGLVTSVYLARKTGT